MMNLSETNSTNLPQHFFDKISQRYVIPAIAVIGIIGNTLNLLVLTRKRIRCSVEIQERTIFTGLVALALSDLCFCFAMIPRAFVGLNTVLFDKDDATIYYQLYCSGLISTFGCVSTWLIVLLALLRYFAICYPFKARELVNAKRTYYAVLVVWILAIIINLPTFWQFREVEIPDKGSEKKLVDLGEMSHGNIYGLVYLWFRLVVAVFVPAITLVFCNVALIRALRNSEKMRTNAFASGHLANSRRITITLITIFVAFICLVFPSDLMDACTHLLLNPVQKVETFIAVRGLTNIAQMLNFSCNFLLYFLINLQFRKALAKLCGCNRTGSNGSRSNNSRFTYRIVNDNVRLVFSSSLKNIDRISLPPPATASRFCNEKQL